MNKIKITCESLRNKNMWYNNHVGEEFELVQAVLWSSPPEYIVRYEDDHGVLKRGSVDFIDAQLIN